VSLKIERPMEAEGDFILISDLFSLSASCQFT